MNSPGCGVRLSTSDVCAVTDATFRQIVHWRTLGLPPSISQAKGSGTQCVWSFEDAVIIQLLSDWSRATGGGGLIQMVLGHVPYLRSALRHGKPTVTLRFPSSALKIIYEVDDAKELVERRLAETGIDKRVTA